MLERVKQLRFLKCDRVAEYFGAVSPKTMQAIDQVLPLSDADGRGVGRLCIHLRNVGCLSLSARVLKQ